MARALQCDRCKKYFSRACVPDLTVHKYYHAYGQTSYDLCDECTKGLKMFLENITVIASKTEGDKNESKAT
jgi:hypothetical protein